MMLSKQPAEFLFSLLREKSEPEKLQRSISNLDSADWQTLCGSVINQGLFPLFYSRLSALKPKGLPSEFLRQFKEAYLLNLQRNIFCEEELLKIISLLQRYNIEVIALKGPIFARLFYQDAGLRQASVDLDLLVKKETLPQIQRILPEIGYVTSQIDPKKDFLQPSSIDQQITQIYLGKKKHDLWSFSLDIHTHLRGFFQQEQIQALWHQARYARAGDRQVLVLGNEDTLLYLSVIAISLFESLQLRYLYDMHRLIVCCKKELDWDKLLRRARDYNLDTCLYFPLALSRSLFCTEIPDSFLRDITPGRVAKDLINLWIGEEKILLCPDGLKFGLLARLILCRYLYSRSWGDFFNKVFIRLRRGGKIGRCYCVKKEPRYGQPDHRRRDYSYAALQDF